MTDNAERTASRKAPLVINEVGDLATILEFGFHLRPGVALGKAEQMWDALSALRETDGADEG